MNRTAPRSVTKTVCVGRFLFDVPQSALLSFGAARVGGWEIAFVGNESEDEFKRRVQARESALSEMKNERQQRSLERSIDVHGENVIGKLFVFDRKWQYHLEWGRRVDSQSISFQGIISSHGKSYELSAPMRSDEVMDRYLRLLRQFDSWDFSRVSGQPGFCFGEGFVHEPLSVDDHEFVMISVTTESHPDLDVVLSTWAGIELDEPLLERDKRNSVKQEHAARFKDLGSGKRIINGIRGAQIADEVFELNGTTSYSFQWESVHEKGNVLRPRILLEMDTGKGRVGMPVDSSLSKEAALLLWNQISSSIRDRPENFSTVKEKVSHIDAGTAK